MHTPLWIKLGMALGLSYGAIFSINLVGDWMGSPQDTHGGTHASTEQVADAGGAGHAAENGQDTGADHASDTGMTGTQPVEHETDISPETTSSDIVEDAAETMVASLAGDAAAGAKSAKKKCGTCHTFASGEKHKIGPNLFGVRTRARATADGYKYSANLKTMGGIWSDTDLDTFLTDPKAFVAGTKMTLKTRKEQDRADLIAWLKTLQQD